MVNSIVVQAQKKANFFEELIALRDHEKAKKKAIKEVVEEMISR